MKGLRTWILLGTVLLASCNLWPEELGQIEIPYLEDEATSIPQTSLLSAVTAPPQTVEQGVEAIQNRKPIAEGESPRALETSAKQTVPLTVEEMRLRVLRNNLKLDVALYEPSIAARALGAEQGRFDVLIGSKFKYQREETPDLEGPLVRFKSDDPALDGREVKFTDVAQTQEALELGLGIYLPLPSGGVVSVEGLWDQKNLIEPREVDQYRAAARFSFSQPLLRNAGRDVNLASIRAARVQQRQAQVETKLSAMRILAAAEKAYWRLYAARRMLDVREDQYRQAQANLDLVRRRVAEGVTPEVEITRANLGVASRLEGLIIAETAWRLRQRQLKVFLAADELPLRGGPRIETTTAPLLAGLSLDAEALLARALEERLELIQVELEIIRRGIDVALRQNQVLPIANLDFQYGTVTREDRFGPGSASFDHPDVSVGLRFEMPLTNQRRREQLEMSLLKRSQVMASKRVQAQAVSQEVYDAVDVITRNWQRIVAARQSVLVAGVNYDAERQQFEMGVRTMREVFESLTALGQAQSREIAAIVDYQVAQLDLAFATGSLLGYAGVELEPLRLPDGPGQ